MSILGAGILEKLMSSINTHEHYQTRSNPMTQSSLDLDRHDSQVPQEPHQ